MITGSPHSLFLVLLVLLSDTVFSLVLLSQACKGVCVLTSWYGGGTFYIDELFCLSKGLSGFFQCYWPDKDYFSY